MFTAGNRVLATPFNIIPIPEKTDKETDVELKWVIEKLCAEEIPKKIDIKNISVDEDGALLVVFDLITTDHKNMFDGKRVDVEVLREGVILKLSINKKGRLASYLQKSGAQKIIKSSEGKVGEEWDSHAPFITPNYKTSEDDWNYMKKIVERIILEKI